MHDFAPLPPDPDAPPLWVTLAIVACLILLALALAAAGGCEPRGAPFHGGRCP